MLLKNRDILTQVEEIFPSGEKCIYDEKFLFFIYNLYLLKFFGKLSHLLKYK